MITQTKILPKVLVFGEVKYYIFSAVFTASAVFFPWLAHQFHVAGPVFLPMHFFVIIAGLLFGWRAGIVVGIASPLISYGITHLPPMAILPETMLELAIYGFSAGILREKNFNIFTALLGAMFLGRLARLLMVLGLGLKTNPIKSFEMSWPGIILQIALIPIIIYLLQKFVFAKRV
ncbi:MAG: ECF transporter S component [Candidatus Nealsonbacteria bacterium]|nr:ECF transporter S component [Candidatus Nealsonbacteria bacterium]